MPDAQVSDRDASSPLSPVVLWRGWLGIFVLSLLLYGATANRGAQWQDSGWHILQIANKQLLHPRGLALSHPVHHWLGRAAVATGMTEACFAITLISALAGAVAVANVFGCVCTLTRSAKAATLSAVSLAIAHTFWQLSTRTEVYTVSAALFAGECWCLSAYAARRRPIHLVGMLLLNGLGVGNHMQAVLTTPVVGFVALHGFWTKRVAAKHVVVAGLGWVVGSLPYTGFVLWHVTVSGEVGGTVKSALFGQFFASQVMNVAPSLRLLGRSGAFLVMNFPNLLVPLAVYGLLRGAACGVPVVARRALLGALILHACFVLRYPVVDHHTFFLPLYVVLALFSGVGFAGVLRWEKVGSRKTVAVAATVLVLLTPVFYAFAPAVARGLDVLGEEVRNKPYRDDYVYVFSPWDVTDVSAEMMSSHAVELAGDRGFIIVEDTMAEFAVRYRAMPASGIEIVNVGGLEPGGVSAALEAGRTIVLVPRRADSPETEPPVGVWRREGDLYVLDPTVMRP